MARAVKSHGIDTGHVAQGLTPSGVSVSSEWAEHSNRLVGPKFLDARGGVFKSSSDHSIQGLSMPSFSLTERVVVASSVIRSPVYFRTITACGGDAWFAATVGSNGAASATPGGEQL
jgi:hypothetical protein